MPRKQKEKSPKKSEDPAMDADAINQLLQKAIYQANAKAEQKLEERLTALQAELTKKYQDEMIELQDAFAQSRGQNPTTKETHIMRELMVDAVVGALHQIRVTVFQYGASARLTTLLM